MRGLLLLVLIFTFSTTAFGADSLGVAKKNALGLTVAPALAGFLFTDPVFENPVTSHPIFTPSIYFSYQRKFSKVFRVGLSAGMFSKGYVWELDLQKIYVPDNVGNPSLSTEKGYSQTNNYQYFAHISLKPNIILLDKNFFIFSGISVDLNYLSYNKRDELLLDENRKIIWQRAGRYQENKLPLENSLSIYSGLFFTVGYNFGRFLVSVEPEFKMYLTNFQAIAYKWNYYVPYTLSLNLSCHYKF